MTPQARSLILLASLAATAAAAVPVATDPNATPREIWAAAKLRAALEPITAENARVLAAVRTAPLLSGFAGLPSFAPRDKEAFVLRRAGNTWLVAGSDPSGVLYGCLELARRVSQAGMLPASLDFRDRPAFKIRGTMLFWMKRGDYNWPITPENFPWFFDRARMLRYLDFLAENRYNAIYFWNGHPFPYFLELAKYPEARMLDAAGLRRNMEQLRWFTEEADRRGIWTFLHFYNIHVSQAFAQAHQHEGVSVQNSAPTPLLVNYMRYCVSEFVRSYPNVGLMLTAGEALHVNKGAFVRDAIIAGIKDTGLHPPLIIRQWQLDPAEYRDIIRPNYDNLFTMMKHNTEMIVSPYPDPRNAEWISYGQSHIINVHENADVKPLRWGSPVFIRQMMELWQKMGAAGFHLYPMVSWLWPDSLDRVSPTLDTVDRDWIWMEAFGRYGWQPARDPAAEERHWKLRLETRFGSPEAAASVYDYYVLTGPVLPALQNMVNIYNMNYHPLAISQEATLNGILHSDRWEDIGDYLARPLDEVTLREYENRYGKLAGDARLQPPASIKELAHGGGQAAPNPLRVSVVLDEMASRALAGLERNREHATGNGPEYLRFINDARIAVHLSRFYRDKLEAALEKGAFDSSGDGAHMDRMLDLLARSVDEYRQVDEFATAAYRQATDLGEWFEWPVVRKEFEDELAFYRGQRALRDSGAEVAFIGVDGPVSDASNVFHWLLEEACAARNWSTQSYAFGPDPLRRAKLAVVYDMGSRQFRQWEPRLKEWVERGGLLMVWDPQARAHASTLLDGIEFASDSAYREGASFAFDSATSPLTQSLGGVHSMLTARDRLHTSIRETGPEWQQLAYTVLSNVSSRQFSFGFPTFGPRWTSLMDPARVPVLVTRQLGSGHVILAQLGTTTAISQPNERAALAGSPIPQLVHNLLTWANGR